jgi:hypothetical protein
MPESRPLRAVREAPALELELGEGSVAVQVDDWPRDLAVAKVTQLRASIAEAARHLRWRANR